MHSTDVAFLKFMSAFVLAAIGCFPVIMRYVDMWPKYPWRKELFFWSWVGIMCGPLLVKLFVFALT